MTPRWPVLLWRLTENLWAGRVVGTSLEVARPDPRRVLADLSARLREEDLDPVLLEATHRRFKVPYRPTWQGQDPGSSADGRASPRPGRARRGQKSFALPQSLDVPVDAVFGANPHGTSSCYLPRLDISFDYTARDRMEDLLQWFAGNWLREAGCDLVLRWMQAPAPRLDFIRGHEPRAATWAKEEAVALDRLPRVAEKLTSRHAAGPAWERDWTVNSVVESLARSEGSLVIVGEPGSGRTTVLAEAIRRVARQRDSRTFWRTTAHRLVAGSRYLGEWQQACDQVAAELVTVNGTLWVEDLVELLRVNATAPEASMAAYWIPAMTRGNLRLTGRLTPGELEAIRGQLPGFAALFEVVTLYEMEAEGVERLTRAFAAATARDQKIVIEEDAWRMAIRLARRHLHDTSDPGRVLKLLKGCLQRAREQAGSRIDEAAVLEHFTLWSGIPPLLADDRVRLTADQVAAELGRRILGQDPAVRAMAQAVAVWKAGMADPQRPVATLLFAGPTGVGKTALARALSATLFGANVRDGEPPLLRVDMSELQHPAQVERWLGTSQGEPGQLARQIRQRPFSVVLFDEIEKAHPLFFDVLLSLLDEGRLTDALGRTASFRSAVIVMTTNLGARPGSSIGFGSGDPSDLSAIRDFFRPEFLNRIDRILPFAPISPTAALAIVKKELGEISGREGIRDRGLTLHFTPDLERWIVSKGFDPAWGARGLQRVIERHVVAALARLLADSATTLAGTELLVDVEDGRVVVG